jgi:Squalene/phytoene synthase
VRWLHHGEIPIPADLWKPSSSWSPLHAHQETFRKSEHEEAKQQQQQQVELDEANDQQLSARTVGLVKSAVEEAEFVQAVQEMASTAAAHLTEARKLQGRVPKQGRAALLPVIPALHYLSLLEKAKYNLFDPQLTDHQQSQFRLLLLLGRTWLTGIF